MQKQMQYQIPMQKLFIPDTHKFDHLRIPIKVIIKATNNFSNEHIIAKGVSGVLYKGELLGPEGFFMVTFKRYKVSMYDEEFYKEMLLLSRYRHENILSLVGYCDDKGEQIFVHEFSTHGSLDKHLNSENLTWLKRLQICLDVARGLNYLHSPSRTLKEVIHLNMKSANILLGANWQAKIADFGLSKKRLVEDSRAYTHVVSSSFATIGYLDPQYFETGKLTKESDIYSFGVILFEVLCGRSAVKDHRETKYLPALVRDHYNKGTLTEIIDPIVRNQMGSDSLNSYSALAYQCLEKDGSGRPTTRKVVESLEEVLGLQQEFEKALEIQQAAARGEWINIFQDDYFKAKNLKHLNIPLKDIELATNGFHADHLIGGGGFGGVYKGELFHFDVRSYTTENYSQYPRKKSNVAIKRLDSAFGQGKEQFLQEIEVLSSLKHQNLVSLLGFCHQDGEMILVYEHASNGSLDRRIRNSRSADRLTWRQCLQICLDVAHGMNYLHNLDIIHRDMKSANVLLGPNLEGIIGDFGLSRTSKNKNIEFSITNVAGTPAYIDPRYYRTGKLTKQSDIHSFGVVLWEVLCGRLAILPKIGDEQEYLLHFAKRHFEENKLNRIIGPHLLEEFEKSSDNKNFQDSINTFGAIAYQCLDDNEATNLTMAKVAKELKKAWTLHVTGVEMLSLEAINSATNNFSKELVIGKGRSSIVYKGEFSLSKGSTVVAVKRFNKVDSYEEGGFFKEIAMLSSLIHENVIPLRGFCEEENEMIVVFEHAYNGSLDKHLNNSTLGWDLRLKISIGAAYGIHYIHSSIEPQYIVHGDIKSSHILLDRDWNATISDLIVSKSDGTLGYQDPHQKTGVVTKESDVYAFGVVLFEILSGKSACEDMEKYPQEPLGETLYVDPETGSLGKGKGGHGVFLTQLAVHCYEEKKLEAIIFHGTMEQADIRSIDIFSAIAYRCLHKDIKQRPTMGQVITELEKAFQFLEEWQWEQKLPRDCKNIIKMSKYPVSPSITKKDLHSLLTSGILLHKEKVWFSISMDGVKNELVSATRFSYKNAASIKWTSLRKSRFSKVARIVDISNLNIQIQIKTQFLTPNKLYGVYLVFKFCDPRKVSEHPIYVNLKYKSMGETVNAYFAEWRGVNKWLVVELFRFFNAEQNFDFEVLLESFSRYYCGSGGIFVEGIEFRPIREDLELNRKLNCERNEQRVLTLEPDTNMQYWAQYLGSDYHELLRKSGNNTLYSSKEEGYVLLLEGILIDNGEKFLSLSKVNGRTCHMLPAKAIIRDSPNVKCLIRSPPAQYRCRFAQVVELISHYEFRIKCDIETRLLSPDTHYACVLVFQISEKCRGLKGPAKARNLLPTKNKETNIISFRPPSLVNLHNIKWIPKERGDGWMEVIVWEFVSQTEQNEEYLPMDLKLINFEGSMTGLILCGIEFRPI